MGSIDARFKAHRAAQPEAYGRILDFVKQKRAEGATDLSLSHFAGELGVDRAVLPHYQRLILEQEPEIGQGVLRATKAYRRPMKKAPQLPAGDYQAMASLRPWSALTTLSLDGHHANRLANDAEDAAAVGDQLWFVTAAKILDEATEVLALYCDILKDPVMRRLTASE